MAAAIWAASTALFAADSGPRPHALALADQVDRLVQLLRDPYAEEYRPGRRIQPLRGAPGVEFVLVLFTLEGFGGGNGHTQHLALFEVDAADARRPHHSLVDVIAVGGRGLRAVESLKGRTAFDKRTGELTVLLDVIENAEGDAPNFPSRKSTLLLVLRDGRLSLRKP